MRDLKECLQAAMDGAGFATPANTMGMGNQETGSGDIPTNMLHLKKKRKKRLRKAKPRKQNMD